MSWRNTYDSWGRVARLLHWSIALLMIYGTVLVIYIVNQEHGVEENIQRYLYWIKVHKSVGLTVLLLALFRVWWLLNNPRPVLPDEMTPKQRRLTSWVHTTFYAVMFLLPVSGFLSSNSVGATTTFWGWFTVPNVFPEKRDVVEFFDWLGIAMPAFIPIELSWSMVLHRLHLVLGYGTAGLIVAHAGAALWHHFVYRDDVLRRMIVR